MCLLGNRDHIEAALSKVRDLQREVRIRLEPCGLETLFLYEVILARLVAVDNFSRRSYSLDCLRMVCL